MGRYFGTNGIRGVPGQDTLTLEFVCDMTMAIGTHITAGIDTATKCEKSDDARADILVGYDGRSTGPAICNAVTAALSYAGIDCTVAGMVSTPCLEYEVRRRHAGGIMITASHNPPEYNGIKVVASDGAEISRRDEAAIEDAYDDMTEARCRDPRPERWGTIRCKDARADMRYIPAIVSQVDCKAISDARLTVAIDPGNGVQGVYARQLCRELGCKYMIINDSVDGQFPGRGPEPTPDNLQALSRLVQESGADIGVAFDGDGDRSMFCDERGSVIIGDRSALILARHVLGRINCGAGPGAPKDQAGKCNTAHADAAKRDESQALIATCLNSSSAAERVAAGLGARVVRTKIGSVEVTQCMRETGALIGYEENGGFMYGRHNAVRDGCMTLALMLEVLAHAKMGAGASGPPSGAVTLSQHTELLPQSYTAKTKVRCTDPTPVLGRMSRVLDVSDDRDGLKVMLQEETGSHDGGGGDARAQRWVLVRPSGTEPALRIYAEAPTQQEADAITQEYARMLLEYDGVDVY